MTPSTALKNLEAQIQSHTNLLAFANLINVKEPLKAELAAMKETREKILAEPSRTEELMKEFFSMKPKVTVDALHFLVKQVENRNLH